MNTDGTYCCVSMVSLIAFVLFTAACRLTPIQREPIVAFPWQRGSLLCVDSYIQVHINTEGTHCCVSVETVVARPRHIVTLYVRCLLS